MEKTIGKLHNVLQKLTGLHRRLLEIVRKERECIVDADLKAIQSITSVKQEVVEEIYQAESERLRAIGELAAIWKKNQDELSLSQVITYIQNTDAKLAEQFRTTYNVLNIMIQRISEQNSDNRQLIEKSLEHIHQMKKNILEEANQNSKTYNSQGVKKSATRVSSLISQEA